MWRAMGICRFKVACVSPCMHLADLGFVLVLKLCVGWFLGGAAILK